MFTPSPKTVNFGALEKECWAKKEAKYIHAYTTDTTVPIASQHCGTFKPGWIRTKKNSKVSEV